MTAVVRGAAQPNIGVGWIDEKASHDGKGQVKREVKSRGDLTSTRRMDRVKFKGMWRGSGEDGLSQPSS